MWSSEAPAGSSALKKCVFFSSSLYVFGNVSQDCSEGLQPSLYRGERWGRCDCEILKTGASQREAEVEGRLVCAQRLRSPLWSQQGPALSSSHCSASETSRRLLASRHRSEKRKGKPGCCLCCKTTDTGILDQVYLIKLLSKFQESDTLS